MKKDFNAYLSLIIVFLVCSIFLMLSGTNSYIIALSLVCFGIYLSLSSFLKLKKFKEAKLWSKASIKLLRSDIVQKEIPDKFLNLIYYYPRVEYIYKVDDIEYKNTSYALDLDSCFCKDSESCQKLIDEIKYVYYNPKNVTESAINTSISKKRKEHYIVLEISGILLLIVGLVVLFLV